MNISSGFFYYASSCMRQIYRWAIRILQSSKARHLNINAIEKLEKLIDFVFAIFVEINVQVQQPEQRLLFLISIDGCGFWRVTAFAFHPACRILLASPTFNFFFILLWIIQLRVEIAETKWHLSFEWRSTGESGESTNTTLTFQHRCNCIRSLNCRWVVWFRLLWHSSQRCFATRVDATSLHLVPPRCLRSKHPSKCTTDGMRWALTQVP